MIITWIISLFKTFWKPIGLLLLLTTACLWSYHKGVVRTEAKMAAKIASLTVERFGNYNKEKTRLELKQSEILKKREGSTDKDRVDSCLLSNDPFAFDCFKR